MLLMWLRSLIIPHEKKSGFDMDYLRKNSQHHPWNKTFSVAVLCNVYRLSTAEM